MKKAKIMFIAIAIVAIVGGMLAFKAKRFADYNVYCATKNANNQIYCTSVPFKWTNIPPFLTTPCITWHNALGLGASRTSSCYTTTTDNQGNPCPTPTMCKVTTTNIP